MADNTRIIIFSLIFAFIGLGLGVIIGYFSRSVPGKSGRKRQYEDKAYSKIIMDEIDPNTLENNLRILTEKPHIAGSDREEKVLVDFVSNKFKDAGLTTEVHPYEVLLSFPNSSDPNYVAILDPEGQEIFKSQLEEKALDPSQNQSDVVNPFNAYSMPGDGQGELVYVNFGRVEDFSLLERTLSVNVSGKICIARYGKIFRGDKAYQAGKFGCVGLILYSDPKEYAVEGAGVYPNSYYLPGTGVQRGTVLRGQGDPQTPDYPSLKNAWRKSGNEFLSRIPVTPIGYDDAIHLLQIMGGPEAPESWRGSLNITYRLGPGFLDEHVNKSVKIHVATRTERKTIHNVIGYIKGHVEPDRYVIFGVHRDAWVFGAVDPSSGQAILLELARVFGEAVKKGWKPRRTVMFCSWGAEEYGLIGSTEWVEEFQKNLAARTVAYINTDTAVTGSYSFYAGAVPSLKELIYDAAKSVPNPEASEVELGLKSLYDSWRRRIPENATEPDTKPFVRELGSGSDYTMFLQLPGITCVDVAYAFDIRTGIDFYPTYHSTYDSYHHMKNFIDPDFKYHVTVAKVMGEIGRELADSDIVPFNLNDYAAKLVDHKNVLMRNFGEKLKANGVNTSLIDDAIAEFQQAATEIHARIEQMKTTDYSEIELRSINDQLMQLDRAFIDHKTNGDFKHVIYAPSQHNKYASSSFPGISDSLFDIDYDTNQMARWDEVRRQYSILVYHLSSAAATLREFTPLKGSSNKL